ncbi:MAG: IS21 family transposase, partial [Planctomycetes bacterium]|nr:IS21 family transposase [Planctomycetota bacterium]
GRNLPPRAKRPSRHRGEDPARISGTQAARISGIHTQAGFSRRTATRVEGDPLRGAAGPPERRRYRTRDDPFAAVWETELVPLLRAEPSLKALTLLGDLQERHPQGFEDRLLRTLQRRVREWRALHGPAVAICFPQEHPPGQTLIADFTVADELGVTLGGAAFPHRLLHARLSCSGWQFARVVLGGESFTALAEGLAMALGALGGVPHELRTDSLSAAYRNLTASDQADVTVAYAAFCSHFAMRATRCNPGESQENGSIESPHGHLKDRLDQALRLRGSRDFTDVPTYRRWVDVLVEKGNARRCTAVSQERLHLRPLPIHAPVTWTVTTARVTTFSTIVVRKGVYSVPSQLKGHQLTIHLYDDRLDCFLGSTPVHSSPRLARQSDAPDRHRYRIDYRHVAAGLRQKPGALLHLAYRDALHPTPVYRATWDSLMAAGDKRHACRVYAGLLYLASDSDCQDALEARLASLLAAGHLPVLATLEAALGVLRAAPAQLPTQVITQHELSSYDELFSTTWATAPEEMLV